MNSSAGTRRIAALLGAALVPPLLATGAAVAVPAHRAAPGCADLVIVGARGAGESADLRGGFGTTAASYADRVVARLRTVGDQRSVVRQHVPFPAAKVRALPGEPRKYFRGIGRGVSWVSDWVPTRLETCPGEQILLVGYSQGAMVMHRALTDLADHVPDSIGRVSAMLISDGYRPRRSRVATRGSADSSAVGVHRALSGNPVPDIPRVFRARTVAACLAGDLVCDYTDGTGREARRGRRIHHSYARRAALADQLAAVTVRDVRRTAAPSWPDVTVEAGQSLSTRLTAEGSRRDLMRFRWAPGTAPPAWPNLDEAGNLSGERVPEEHEAMTYAQPVEVAGLDGRWVSGTLTVSITEKPRDYAGARIVSVAREGQSVHDGASSTDISGDGARVAWITGSGPGGECHVTDVTTETVTPIGAGTGACQLSTDGRYVVFDAVDLQEGADGRQLYLRDLEAGTTTLVSAAVDGTPGNNSSYGGDRVRAVSDDGTRVAFTSWASNLTGDGQWHDFFVKDLTTGEVTGYRLPGPNGPDEGLQMTADGSVVLVEQALPARYVGDPTLRVPVTVWARDGVRSDQVVEVPDTPAGEWSVFDAIRPATGVRHLVFGAQTSDNRERLVRVALDTGEAVVLAHPPNGALSHIEVSISRDGRRAAATGSVDAGDAHGRRSIVTLWEEGAGTRVLTSTTHLWLDSMGPVIAADGSAVAFTSLEPDVGGVPGSPSFNSVWMPLP